jgi:hypothetical protein
LDPASAPPHTAAAAAAAVDGCILRCWLLLAAGNARANDLPVFKYTLTRFGLLLLLLAVAAGLADPVFLTAIATALAEGAGGMEFSRSSSKPPSSVLCHAASIALKH